MCVLYGDTRQRGSGATGRLLAGPDDTLHYEEANERYERSRSNSIEGARKENTRERPRKTIRNNRSSDTIFISVNEHIHIYTVIDILKICNAGRCRALRAGEAKCPTATSKPLFWEQSCRSYKGSPLAAELLTEPGEIIHYGNGTNRNHTIRKGS
jgi:hypothetical protein